MRLKVVVHEADEGGFWAEVPAIPGCATMVARAMATDICILPLSWLLSLSASGPAPTAAAPLTRGSLTPEGEVSRSRRRDAAGRAPIAGGTRSAADRSRTRRCRSWVVRLPSGHAEARRTLSAGFCVERPLRPRSSAAGVFDHRDLVVCGRGVGCRDDVVHVAREAVRGHCAGLRSEADRDRCSGRGEARDQGGDVGHDRKALPCEGYGNAVY